MSGSTSHSSAGCAPRKIASGSSQSMRRKDSRPRSVRLSRTTSVPERGAQPALECEVLPDTVLFDTDARKFALVWRVDLPMRRGVLEFSEAWVGPPTAAMARARREGRRYVRAVATGDGGKAPE